MDDLAKQLRQTDLFREVELGDLEALIHRMKELSFPSGAVLFEANDPGDTMYIIREGRIRIFMHDTQGNEITLTHYSINEVFGELSPIDSKPRSASAAAAESLTVLALNRADFLDFLNERPQIGLAMMRSLSQRLRNTTTYLEEFKPLVFEPGHVDKGEDLRRGASDLVAGIIDSKLDDDAPSDTPETPAAPPSMGIFDRIVTPPQDEE